MTHSLERGSPPAPTDTTPNQPTAADTPMLAWVGPFVVFMVWLAVDKYLPVANPAKELLRDSVLLASIIAFSRNVLPTRAPYWLASIGLGLGVFVLWVAPDALIPGWR